MSGTQATQAVAGTTSTASTAGTRAARSRRSCRRCRAQSCGEFAGQCGSRQHLDRLGGQRGAGDAWFRFPPSATSPPTPRRSASITPAPRSPLRLPSTCRKGNRSSTALAAIAETMNEIHMPVSIRGGSYGTAKLFQQSAGQSPLMLLAALLAIYVVLGMLYESYSQPLTILSTLPSAGPRGAAGADGDRHRIQPDRIPRHPAADRHRQEKRHHDGRFRARCRAHARVGSACRHRARLLAALPADHDDDLRGHLRARCRWPLPMAMAPKCAVRSASRSSAA